MARCLSYARHGEADLQKFLGATARVRGKEHANKGRACPLHTCRLDGGERHVRTALETAYIYHHKYCTECRDPCKFWHGDGIFKDVPKLPIE